MSVSKNTPSIIMWKYISIFLVLFIFSYTPTFAQSVPEILPEDFSPTEGNIVCYCRPGVRNKSRSKGAELSYGFLGAGTFEQKDTQASTLLADYQRLNRFKIDTKIPILLKDHISILGGYQFFAERFNFENLGSDFSDVFSQLDGDLLKSNSFSLIVSKPLNETRYIAGRLRYTSNGNYEEFISFSQNHSIYKAIVVYGIKPSDDFEWGIGISYSKGFRNTNIIPFLLYNRTFNNEWGIEAVLPGYVFLRCNINHKLIVLGGVEFGSQSYRIDTDFDSNEGLAFAYNHSEIINSIRLEYSLAPWVWANLKVGYQVNFNSDFEERNLNSQTFEVNPTDALFLNIGIFISPPSS